MLYRIVATIPDKFAAAIIVGIAFAVSRFVSHLMSNILGGFGFDALPDKFGLGQAFLGRPHSLR